MSGVPEELPPFREINHTIPLIDEGKLYKYHLPRCPDSLKPQLLEKMARYERAGWWISENVPQAMPMMCIVKKDGKLRTVFDCRQRNENTIHDVSPFPDQEQIRLDVARAKYRSKIDLSDAYEQIRISPDDVWKTAFATVYGTMLSTVMQQGDCNAPSTFQRLMTYTFRDFIGRFVHVYMDDIFIFSNTIEEHEEHLHSVFTTLKNAHLYLKESKVMLYAKSMECLGHVIDDRGLHADSDKMSKVRNWRIPRDYGDIQRFLGLVQYLANFMPDVSMYTGPLAEITRNGHAFEWRPIHQKCFESIKALACKVPILQPIDPSTGETIWVICDASVTGVGALYGQGPNWETCRPAGFMSKKFTTAQHAYRVFELETIAILEALLKWEDKLLGYPITIVTDHKALEFFKTQGRLSPRQTRWMEFLERFEYIIKYIQGILNKVSDCFSRYFENDRDGETHNYDDYVSADAKFDPEGEELPVERKKEILDIRRELEQLYSQRVIGDDSEERTREAAALYENREDPRPMEPADHKSPLPTLMSGTTEWRRQLRDGYAEDALFSKVQRAIGEHPSFTTRDDILWTKNRLDQEVVCVPRAKKGQQSITGKIIDAAHTTLGHFGHRKTSDYIRRWYWWPGLGREVEKFCASCEVCQTTKTSNQMPAGLLHSLPIPTRPWSSIAMDFLGPFPRSKDYDYLWVVICRLTVQVHLIPVTTKVTASELAWLYVKEIVRLHGVADSIVSDRDSKFTSKFWQETHRLLGTRLLMSTAFHPQTDGVTERANRSIAQILRGMVRPDQSDWVAKLPIVEFALNSTVSSTTGFAPFELNGGYLPRMITSTPASDIPGVQHFATQVLEHLEQARDHIIASRTLQTHHANEKRRDENVKEGKWQPITEGELVYLSTDNLQLPRGRAKKLLPKFIGPYSVLKAFPRTSTYQLDLPDDLKSRRVHSTFHVSRLRRHEPNDEAVFPSRIVPPPYDMGAYSAKEYQVDEIIDHYRDGRSLKFKVKWNLGDVTWEPLEHVNAARALDVYLELQGVSKVAQLP